MNRKQKIILWIGITVIVVMGIFPPWVQCTTFSERTVGYSFILNTPESDGYGWYARPDKSRLLIQWAMVAVVTGGLIVTFKDKNQKDN